MTTLTPIGDHLRGWRQRRRLSQLDLAGDANISARHLSFVETGRAQPSRDMVLNLADQLDVPLRDRNLLLVSAGYAPVFPERALADPMLAAARGVIDTVLSGHATCPALAVDRHWQLIAANDAVQRLLAGVGAALLVPPVNVLRLSLHPDGLAPRILNLAEWRAHILARLRREIDLSADSQLETLLAELRGYPSPAPVRVPAESVAIPLRLAVGDAVLSMISTTTVFGTPVDITLSEIAIEAFFPADEATAIQLRLLAGLGTR